MLIHKITLIIAECVTRKFGRSILEQNSLLIKKKCNQKCIDRANKQKKTLIGLLVDNFCSFFDHFCLVCMYVLIICVNMLQTLHGYDLAQNTQDPSISA